MKDKDFETLIKHIKKDKIKPSAKGVYKDCYIFPNAPDYVVLKAERDDSPMNPCNYQKAISRLKNWGLKTPSIVYHTKNKSNYFEIQEKVAGNVLFKLPFYEERMNPLLCKESLKEKIIKENDERLVEVLQAPTEQFAEFFDSMFLAHILNIDDDLHANNIMYDKNNGFSLIDLPTELDSILSIDSLDNFLENYWCFENDLKQKILQPFKWGISSDCKMPFYNLIGHKIMEGIKHSKFNFNKYQMENFERCFLAINDKHGNEQAYACNDAGMKLTLINCGLITPTKDEFAYLDFINTRNIKHIEKSIRHLYWPNDNKFDAKQLEKCVNATTIDDKPALEYYNEVDCSSLEFVRALEKNRLKADIMEQ